MARAPQKLIKGTQIKKDKAHLRTVPAARALPDAKTLKAPKVQRAKLHPSVKARLAAAKAPKQAPLFPRPKKSS